MILQIRLDFLSCPSANTRRAAVGRLSVVGSGDNEAVPPRSLWSGSITFGLVSVPVRLFPAIAEHKLHFHYLHEKDSGPIGYQKVCKKEGKPVPDDEVVKAFEDDGEFVILSDEDFEQAQIEGYRSIEITDFVPSEEIDPIFFAKTYYAGPAEGGEHVYALLARAMEDTGLAAVAKFTMREKQHLGALRVRQGVITLEQLHFADEIRPVDEIKPSGQRVSKEELQMAGQLIASITGPWKPEKYKDTYRDQLLAVIAAKRRGGKVEASAEVPDDEPLDLMEALRQSIRSGGKARSAGKAAGTNGSSRAQTKAELEKRARAAGIEGRSRMSKADLIEALEHR
jgi:DNA end-binding protein Ku